MCASLAWRMLSHRAYSATPTSSINSSSTIPRASVLYSRRIRRGLTRDAQRTFASLSPTGRGVSSIRLGRVLLPLPLVLSVLIGGGGRGLRAGAVARRRRGDGGGPDQGLDLARELGVVDEEGAGVLPPLAQAQLAEAVEGAHLLDDAVLHAKVDDVALAADAHLLSREHHVELGRAEGRRHLVLYHARPHAITDDLLPLLEGLDAPDVDAHRAVELQRPTARRHLRVPEDDADLLPQLVDEDHGGLRLGDGAGELAQGLGHEARLEAGQRVAHLALDLGPGHEGGDAIDDDDVDGVGADQGLDDLQRLLAGVRLGHEQVLDLDADGAGVDRLEGVLHVDVGGHAARLLGLGDYVLGEGRLSRRLGAVDLGNAAPGDAADAQGQVEAKGAGRDGLDIELVLLAQAHDGAAAELLLDLADGELNRAL